MGFLLKTDYLLDLLEIFQIQINDKNNLKVLIEKMFNPNNELLVKNQYATGCRTS